MKILFVQDSLGAGGAERSNAELWYYLRDHGVEFKVLLLKHQKEGFEQEILDAGFDVDFLNETRILSAAKKIAHVIGDYRPDIVHSVLMKSFLAVRFAKLKRSFRSVESIVNCSYDPIRLKDPKMNRKGFLAYKYLNRFTTFLTDNFVAITQEVKDHTVKHLKLKPEQIDVIYRGRKENPFLDKRQQVREELLNELDLPANSQLFLHVGRQEYQKGHIDLLKAIKEVDEYLYQKNVKFILCGRKGAATSELNQFLKENSIKTPILFLGHRNDVAKIQVASDVFVFPSLFEGLGGALLEAQAAELPVICSDIKVFEEVVNFGDNAFSYPVGDFHQLSQKLLKLAGADQLQRKMGEKSLKNFRQKFKIESIHNQFLNYYKNLIA